MSALLLHFVARSHFFDLGFSPLKYDLYQRLTVAMQSIVMHDEWTGQEYCIDYIEHVLIVRLAWGRRESGFTSWVGGVTIVSFGPWARQ